MFMNCFCSSKRQSTFKEGPHSSFINARLNSNQIQMLKLIYEDLSSREANKLLSYQNFLNFFDLTGLWGAKLFHEFDQDRSQYITMEEFLYGISKTIKAPEDNKIQLLYSFFEDKNEPGIRFKQFTKMLYNYSKQQLKQILIDDGFLVESMTDLAKNNISTLKQQEPKIFHFFSNNVEEKSSFDQAYNQMIDLKEEETCLKINTNNMIYEIKYSNMNTLVMDFAAKIYKDNNLNTSDGHLTFNQFKNWIKAHRKLFLSYFSMFQQDVWGYADSHPRFMDTKIQNSCSAKLSKKGDITEVVIYLVGDSLIISPKNKKGVPSKIMCLSGLTIQEIKGYEGYGMKISHRSEFYEQSVIYFNSKQQQVAWLQLLKIYGCDTLHNNYWIQQKIGTGKFSIVYRCIEKQTDKTYALKSIQNDKLTEQARRAISNESQIMRIINHNLIVKYKETIMTKNYTYIITEYIPGQDLFEYVKKNGHLSEYESAFIIGQIIKAVSYLHGLQILHRDLKPQNIMVMYKKDPQCLLSSPLLKNGKQVIEKIKIIDFGLSYHISQLQQVPKEDKVSGTPNYIAPEVLLGQEPSVKSDNFAIGSILYFLLSGKMPFVGHNSNETLLKTVRGDYDLESKRWQKISNEAKDLLSQLLEIEPQSRIDLHSAVNHNWFKKMHKKLSPDIHVDSVDICDIKLEKKTSARSEKMTIQLLNSFNFKQSQDEVQQTYKSHKNIREPNSTRPVESSRHYQVDQESNQISKRYSS